MTADVGLLILTAFTVGVTHTLFGPDHYVPFVAMARTHGWSPRKTVVITSLCGAGHIVGSILLGAIGLLLGTLVFRLEAIESFRGDVASWLLIGFGGAYLIWGVRRAVRNVPHSHWHAHADGTVHTHLHRHDSEHLHLHREQPQEAAASVSSLPKQLAPWLLFLVFAFGPCEVLIPLLMYPAAQANVLAVVGVVGAFAVATVATMVLAVMLIVFGISQMKIPDLHRYSHALAGMAVLMCGVMVKFGL